ESSHRYWELTPDPPQDWQVLITAAPPLMSHELYFIKIKDVYSLRRYVTGSETNTEHVIKVYKIKLKPNTKKAKLNFKLSSNLKISNASCNALLKLKCIVNIPFFYKHFSKRIVES
ncbi:mCG145460, partial [Mus musculus]